jgi:hypothetical protein
MESGIDFLRTQISNAVLQHGTFLKSLEDHESQAQDERFRDLCSRHIPHMREHQRMLEDLQRDVRADQGVMKKALGTALGIARDLADVATQDDFFHLVGDIIMARQAEDTFKTFREAGRQLGIQRLSQIGEVAERHHDSYVHEANRLVQQMFVEHARGAEHAFDARSATELGSRP